MHLPSVRRDRHGFSIVEIVVVIIIMVLMLIIIVPHLLLEMKARKAARVMNDLASLNAAIQHYALDHGKVSGVQLDFADIRKYLDPRTDIYKRGGRDILGDSYGPFVVGIRPMVPPRTVSSLTGVVQHDYWSPYIDDGTH